MSNIILDPIDQIEAFSNLADYAKRKIDDLISKYGGFYTRRALTKTVNSLGSVTDITETHTAIRIMFFDRYKSDSLVAEGRSGNSETLTSHKSNVRAYCNYDCPVQQGDYILVNYNSSTNTYTEKYYIIEKEVHEVVGQVVFYTLYLRREAM